MKYYESKYTGAEVDALLGKVESGDVGGKVTVDSALSTESENPVQNKVITEELGKKATNEALGALSDSVASLESKKADKDGVYSGMTVGRSIDLLGVEDVEEGSFVFRPTDGDGSIKDGVAVVKRVKGDSVVWNQKLENGDFSQGTKGWYAVHGNSFVVEDGVATITLEGAPTSGAYAYLLSTSGYKYIVGHKYLISAEGNIPRQTTLEIQSSRLSLLTPSVVTPSINTWTRVAVIGEGIMNESGTFAFFARQTVGGWEAGDQYKVRNYQIIDLTQMFGAGNEPTTIEDFNARVATLGVDLNAYNAGEVVNMKASGIKSVGFNAWDEEWEVGRYNTSAGAAENSPLFIRSKNAIKVIPNTQYYITLPDSSFWIAFLEYDSEGKFLRNRGGCAKLITTSADCKYVRFYVTDKYGTTYNHDICINLVHSGYRNGEYEPYVEDVLDLPTLDLFPNGMNKIGDVYDEYDSEKSVQRIGIRPYQSGDESIENVLTDGTSTFYVLEEPIVTPHDYRLAYKAWDFGTEQVIADGNTTAITAGITYEFNARDTIRGNKTRLDVLEPIVAGKIDKEADDYYPQLAVGLADNLSGVDVVDSEVNFRRSGGGAISDGVARVESIKGNSVVWNQLRSSSKRQSLEADKGGISIQFNKGETLQNITGTYEGFEGDASWYNAGAFNDIKGIIGHKYLCSIRGNKNTFMTVYGYGGPSIPRIKDSVIITAETATNINIVPGLDTSMAIGTVVNENIFFLCHDLTQMFGAGNEPTTIEEFYARIPMGVDLNAYNEGEVIHMDVQSIESVGVNQWDEEWEVGGISGANGTNISNNSLIRSKNYIPIMPCTKYYSNIAFGQGVFFYDDKKEFIIRKYNLSSIPQNARYMRFVAPSEYGTTYKNDICINLSDTSINGKYFPYVKRTEDLSIIRKYFPQGMKSAGSAHDEIRFNKASGKWEAVQRIGSVDLGTLNWTIDSQGRFQSTNLAATISVVSSHAYANILTYLYTTDTSSNTYNKVNDNVIAVSSDGIIKVVDSSYTDAASFKAMLQEKQVILYYELAEPIVTELDADDQFKDLDYQVWNCGTEKAIAEGKSAPLAADITYGFNAIGKIKELEKQMATLMTQLASLTSNNA